MTIRKRLYYGWLLIDINEYVNLRIINGRICLKKSLIGFDALQPWK